MLRNATTVERLDLGAEVGLTHLRHEAAYTGSLALEADSAEISTVYGDGAGRQQQPDLEPLSEIVSTLNERFGLNLNEADQLLFDQFEQTWLGDQDVTAQAQNNTLDNFRLVFDRTFLKTVIGRMDDNGAIYKRVLDDPEFRQALMDLYATRIYREARKP